jgi:hypothetical protein
MKHLEKYKFKRYLKVDDIISLYGEEDAAVFLNIIFKGKYVKVENGIFTFKNKDEIHEGVVYKIFYINSRGFMILRFTKEYNDIIINRASIQAYNDLDYELGEITIKSKKYNL